MTTTLWIATHSIDIAYAESLGIDLHDVQVARLDVPPAEELALVDEILSRGIASGDYDIIIVD